MSQQHEGFNEPKRPNDKTIAIFISPTKLGVGSKGVKMINIDQLSKMDQSMVSDDLTLMEPLQLAAKGTKKSKQRASAMRTM